MTSKSPVGDISVVTLIRTDTTLDHSQKAEKVYVCVSKACFDQKTRAERAVLGLPCHTDDISYGAVVRRTNFHRETRRDATKTAATSQASLGRNRTQEDDDDRQSSNTDGPKPP